MLWFYLLSVVSGIFLFLGDPNWFPDFYRPKVMAAAAWIFGFLIYLPKLVFKPKTDRQRDARDRLQMMLAVMLSVSALGTLGLFQLYKVGFEYDKLVHFIFSLLAVYAIADYILAWQGIGRNQSLLWAVVLVALGGIGWEFFEFYSSRILGIEIFKLYGQNLNRDTILDLILNGAGILLGALLFIRRERNMLG